MTVKCDPIADEKMSKALEEMMLHSERVITAEQGAYMVGLTLSAFRTKVSRLRIKGKKDGRKVFYILSEIVKVNRSIKAKRESKLTKKNSP